MTDLLTAARARRFEGKVVLVAGTGKGAGRACALRIGLEGARVIAVARSDENVREMGEILARHGVQHGLLRADMAGADGAGAAVDFAQREFGGLDALICTTGAFEGGGIDAADHAQLERMLAQNLRAAFCASKAATPLLRARGRGAIVITGAVFGAIVPGPGLLAYNTAKAAVLGFCRSLAGDLAPAGIRVNALLPGAISHTFDEALDPAHARPLLAGPATPQDVAAAAAFLASDEACFITGAALVLDGGFSVSRKPY